jgi:Flp pilus assembly protein TadB
MPYSNIPTRMASLYTRYKRLNDWFRDHPIADDILTAASIGLGVVIAVILTTRHGLTTALAVGLITFVVGVLLRVAVYRRHRVANAVKDLY